jgi:hypothetical protein
MKFSFIDSRGFETFFNTGVSIMWNPGGLEMFSVKERTGILGVVVINFDERISLDET